VASAVIVLDTRTNRRRIEAHESMIRNSLPDDGRRLRAWLDDPSGGCDARLFWLQPRASDQRARTRVRRPDGSRVARADVPAVPGRA
jgi:hypothetical protein